MACGATTYGNGSRCKQYERPAICRRGGRTSYFSVLWQLGDPLFRQDNARFHIARHILHKHVLQRLMSIYCPYHPELRIFGPLNMFGTSCGEDWGTESAENCSAEITDCLGHSASRGNRPYARIDVTKSGWVGIQERMIMFCCFLSKFNQLVPFNS